MLQKQKAAVAAIISLLSAFTIEINSIEWNGMLIMGVVGSGLCALAFCLLGLVDKD